MLHVEIHILMKQSGQNQESNPGPSNHNGQYPSLDSTDLLKGLSLHFRKYPSFVIKNKEEKCSTRIPPPLPPIPPWCVSLNRYFESRHWFIITRGGEDLYLNPWSGQRVWEQYDDLKIIIWIKVSFLRSNAIVLRLWLLKKTSNNLTLTLDFDK